MHFFFVVIDVVQLQSERFTAELGLVDRCECTSSDHFQRFEVEILFERQAAVALIVADQSFKGAAL